ncbi:DMT family transporter [Clostridium sp. P21]|uniref:DMT family transporter n=1 Tax=Clostridium muellerianum TaxID=2716538 RepID=A0A7Y0EMH6_9CLOT|nr:DMT family transporter [Clostridium muellerianum]NMM65170.1 DMT family transporter [Clostridium muellerianum]
MNSYKGVCYALLSSTAFGVMPIFARIAYSNGSNPTTALIFRFSLSALILFFYLKCKRININLKKKQILLLIAIGITGYTLTTQTLFVSYNYLGAGLATTLHFIYPVVVCIAGFILYKDKMSAKKIISLLLAAIGVYSLVGFKNNTVNILGVALALFSGLSYGLTMVSFNLKSIRSLDNRVTTMYLCVGSSIGTVLCGMSNNSIVLNFNFKTILCYLGISVISTILSIILLLKAIELIGVSTSSILGTFEPIVSVFLGVLFLNEEMTFPLLFGSVLIIISTIILAKDKNIDYDQKKAA